MFLNKVSYCHDDLAIKRLKYITSDITVDRYFDRDGKYTLLYNTKLGTTLLLYKENDANNWLALFRTNYTKNNFIYCLIAARIICKNVHIIVNDVDVDSIKSEAKLLNKAGCKLKLISSNMFAAIAKGEYNPLLHDVGSFLVEKDNRVPLSINRKKNDFKYT